MIYLLYGEEKYELYKFVDKVKKKYETLEQGVNYFSITKENIAELENIYDMVTFFGEGKLTIIKDTSLKFDAQSLIDNNDENDDYVIIEDSLDKRTTAYKLLSKKAEVHEFKFLNENDMVTYIVTTLKAYKLNISREDAQYMVSRCSVDKNNIINEMKKLTSYLEENSTITKNIIDKVCARTFEAKIFDMLEFATNRKNKEAIKALDELLALKEPAIKIAVMLYKQIKQMFEIKYLKQAGSSNPNEILKIHPFAYSKIAKASERYTINELKVLMQKFDEYDEGIKNGDKDMDIGLKEIILCI